MSRLSFRACVGVSCFALSGCAVDGYTWEQAGRVDQVVIKMTEVADVGPLCARYLPGQPVMACAVQHLDYCEIIVPPNSPALVAHEAAHCLGYMHPGQHNILTAARKQGPPGAAQRNASASAPSTGMVP